MGRLKATAEHVWAQPVKVRVAVVILLTFITIIVGLVVASTISALGLIGCLVTLGTFAVMGTLFWAAVTVSTSNL